MQWLKWFAVELANWSAHFMLNQKADTGVSRFKVFLESRGVQLRMVDLPATTRTAIEAAQALNCDLNQIVKSLLFTGDRTGCHILVLVSGTNRVDTQRLSEVIGEKVHLSDAHTVQSVTGYPIGAVSPFGLIKQPIMIIDEDLGGQSDVWISGGSDQVLANISYQQLCELTRGKVTPVNRALAKPVIIVPYDPKWPEYYKSESGRIRSVMGPSLKTIDHVGSTAIPGLSAKPIIDILGGVFKLKDSPHFIPKLEKLGYHYIPEYEAQLPERRYLTLVENGRTTVHLHLAETSSTFWRNQLAFRDRLLSDDQLRDDYGKLKYELALKYGKDRVGYTDAKSSFILRVLQSESK
jgi:GrpB-like predicted nucleotidyltransferase (UPF0157 family)/prolyl-tRNA editing enzyme YbaK/EbsC (Cys-tRNA(Pro) deacylase)